MSHWNAYSGRRTEDNMPTLKKKPNKQHDARAASFKRIAKALRATAKRTIGAEWPCLNAVAKVMDDEAKLLRSMR